MKKKIKKENTNFRFNILTILIYIIGIILISKLFELQIVKGSEYRELSNTRLSRESILEASRGEIYDRSGNILATTTSSFNIELYKTKTDNKTLNDCILNLIRLFESYNISYQNNFPINNELTEYTIAGEDLKKWLSKYKLDENNSNVIQLRHLIKLRNNLMHNTEALEIAFNDMPNIDAQVIDGNLVIPEDNTIVEFVMKTTENIVDNLTDEMCIGMGKALVEFKDKVAVPYLTYHEFEENDMVIVCRD